MEKQKAHFEVAVAVGVSMFAKLNRHVFIESAIDTCALHVLQFIVGIMSMKFHMRWDRGILKSLYSL